MRAGAGKSARHALQGIACIVAAVLFFAALDTTTKFVSVMVPVVMLTWVRYLFQTLITAAALLPRRGRALLRTRRPLMQFLRGLLLLISSVTAFFSLRYMPVGEFTAIAMITPLVLTVVAAWSLHERVSWLRWTCVLGGFTGSMVVIRPGTEVFHWTLLLPLLIVASNTSYQVLTSRLVQTEDPGTLHFYSGLVGLLLATAALPFAWQSLSWHAWGLLLVISVFSTLGHFLLILAYGRAPVAVLTPYLYLQIGFAAIGGWLVFSYLPDAVAMAGIAIVTVSGALGTWLTGREARSQQGAVASADSARLKRAPGPTQT